MKKEESKAYLLISIMLWSVVMVAGAVRADTASVSVLPGPLLAMPEGSSLEIDVVGSAADRRLLLGGVTVRDGRGNGKGWRITAGVDGQVTSIGSAGRGEGLGTHVVAARLPAGAPSTTVEVTIQSE